MSGNTPPDKRTLRQNASLHLWFSLVAQELNSAGLNVQQTLYGGIELDWTPELVKAVWRQVQKTKLGKESTTELTTKEIDAVYEELNRWLAQNCNIHIPWPSSEKPMI